MTYYDISVKGHGMEAALGNSDDSWEISVTRKENHSIERGKLTLSWRMRSAYCPIGKEFAFIMTERKISSPYEMLRVIRLLFLKRFVKGRHFKQFDLG